MLKISTHSLVYIFYDAENMNKINTEFVISFSITIKKQNMFKIMSKMIKDTREINARWKKFCDEG